MPDPARPVVAALDRLTTQATRIADALTTPVVRTDDDTPATTVEEQRHTADTITDDALEQLYARLDTLTAQLVTED